MSNVTTNKNLDLVVGTASQPGSVAATPDQLVSGAVGAYTEAGALATGTERRFFLARGGETPGKFMRTNVIDLDSRGAYADTKVGTPDVSQVDFIGFNGVSGDIQVIADNMYYVRYNMQELLGSASDARVVKHAVFHTGNTPSGALISLGIAASTNLNFSKDPEQKLHATVVVDANDDTFTKGFTTVTNGSRIVTTNSAHSAFPGDRIRLGSISNDYKATTVLISKVIDANTVEITNTWYGETTTLSDSFVIPAGNLTGSTKYGVKIVGQPLDWRRGSLFHNIVVWDMTIEDWGATPITNETGGAKGVFTGREVADLETFAQGFYGEQYRVSPERALFPADAYADPNDIYDGWRWHHSNDEVVGIGATPVSQMEALVCLPSSESGSAIATLLTSLLT